MSKVTNDGLTRSDTADKDAS